MYYIDNQYFKETKGYYALLKSKEIIISEIYLNGFKKLISRKDHYITAQLKDENLRIIHLN